VADQATIARPYARAAFDHAHAAGELAAWGDYLARASATVVDVRVKPLIGNPHVERAALVQLVREVAGAERHDAFGNFLRLLAENGRLESLPAIAAQYADLRAAVENTIEVKVTAAMPLSDEQSKKLADALTQRLARTVRLHTEIDPGLIGGAVVRAGDFVVDGSLRGRIERLNNTMAGG
jgi:F-type H+-transporting ATPase subunit delta